MKDINMEIQNDILNLNGDELKNKILAYHPLDVANVLKEMSDDERKKVLDLLSPAEAANIFEYLNEEESADILEDMDSNKSSKIISNMELDDAVDVVNELDESVKLNIINKIDEDVKQDIIELSKYSDEQAGSIMTDNYLSLDVDMEVSSAMMKLVKESTEQEIIDILFVLDGEKLVGLVDLKDLIIARKTEKIKDIMSTNFKFVEDTQDIKEATDIIKEYNLLALPVLSNGILKGIITIDDAMDYVVDDVSDDYDKMAALVGDNSTSFKDVIKSRLFWLVILLILSFIVSSVMKQFDGVIASVTALVFFQSLILDMGGNAGTQSLATTVVEISQGELADKKTIKKHLFKELRAGLLNSMILGICAFGLSYIFIIIRGLTGNFTPFSLALVIGLSMMVALAISNFVGSLIPIILYKFKIDPAVASGPFISTLNDIISVLVYYALAYAILIAGGIK